MRDSDHVDSRTLGALPAMALVAGSMLGIGIFIAPGEVAVQLDHPGTFLAVWLLGGLSALAGALSIAELGAMMPRAGGDYPYLRLAYGPGVAFAAGWLQLLAIFPGSLATMAHGTANFQLPVVLGSYVELPAQLGVPMESSTFWAISIIVGLTALNHVGVALSGRVQLGLTGIPVVILLVASLVVLVTQGGGGAWSGADTFEFPAIGATAAAFLPVYFAYSGWYAAIFVGGEIKDPARALPRALVLGTAGVTLLYLIMCVGFLSVFDMGSLAKVGEVGSAAAGALFGPVGTFGVTMLIVLAMFGSINGTVLTGSRIGYAMAKHGHCVPAAGKLHPKHRTPVFALWMQAAFGIALVATQSFEELLNYTVAAMLVTGTLTVFAVVILRRKMPDTVRPYRTWGYPYTPLVYAISSGLVFAVLATKAFAGPGDRDITVPMTLAWFVGALLIHRVFLRRREQPNSEYEPPT